MSRLIEEMHELAKGMYASGVIDECRMQEHEALYRIAQTPKYTGAQVKEIRTRLNLSESRFAGIIKTTERTVRAWESGARNPAGVFCLVLDLLNRKGLEALS